MKSKEELFNMTVLELKEYVNSLSNPKLKKWQKYLKTMNMKETRWNFLRHRSCLTI